MFGFFNHSSESVTPRSLMIFFTSITACPSITLRSSMDVSDPSLLPPLTLLQFLEILHSYHDWQFLSILTHEYKILTERSESRIMGENTRQGLGIEWESSKCPWQSPLASGLQSYTCCLFEKQWFESLHWSLSQVASVSLTRGWRQRGEVVPWPGRPKLPPQRQLNFRRRPSLSLLHKNVSQYWL